MPDVNSLANQIFDEPDALRPSWKTRLKHLAFLLATVCTSTIAGTLYPFGKLETLPTDPEPETSAEVFQFVLSLPLRYFHLIQDAVHQLLTNAETLRYGLSFSLSLLFILICHESGHYIACRLYKVDATLPYFIPTPPMLGPAGTFGAFIKILSPLPSRRATFDIGVAGPIAGFLALIPIAVIGLMTSEQYGSIEISQTLPSGTLVFSDPLLFKFFAWIFSINLQTMSPNSFYFAAWVGLLVTALNLIPSGQLDGGHAVYAIFGERIHKWTGRIAFVVMAVLSVCGWIYFNSPSGFLFTIILGIMMRIRHPKPYYEEPLDTKRILIAVLTLVIFILCFSPFPIQIS